MLSLDRNYLSGTLPAALGQLTNLTVLSLWANDLSGTLPAALGQLTNLTVLDLWANDFSGSIPSWLGQLTKLTKLHLNGSDFQRLDSCCVRPTDQPDRAGSGRQQLNWYDSLFVRPTS